MYSLHSQASLFGCSFPALFTSHSRQRSLAGTQQCTDGHPNILHTASILGVLFCFSAGSTRSMRTLTAQSCSNSNCHSSSTQSRPKLLRILAVYIHCSSTRYSMIKLNREKKANMPSLFSKYCCCCTKNYLHPNETSSVFTLLLGVLLYYWECTRSMRSVLRVFAVISAGIMYCGFTASTVLAVFLIRLNGGKSYYTGFCF